MRALWLLVVGLGGCTTVGHGGSGSGGAGIYACGAATAFDAPVFAALTANDWQTSCGGGDGLPPTCTTIELSSDGSYAWTAVSDVVERDQHGRWNFLARDDRSGIVCLDTGAVLAFSLLDHEGLTLGELGLQAATPLTASGSRGALTAVASDPLYAQLSVHAWDKTNAFDLERLADHFELARDGSFQASYRDGACTHGGSWSLDLQPRTTGPAPVLSSRSDANTCDTRGTAPAQLPASDVPRFDDAGRVIFFDSAYRAPGSGDGRSWFSFDSYSDSVATSGYLSPELSASAPTTLDLTFTNRSTLTKQLASLTVRLTPLAAGAPSTTLATIDLSQVSLAPGSSSPLSLTISPPAAAPSALFELALSYSDSEQPFTSRGDFTGPVTP